MGSVTFSDRGALEFDRSGSVDVEDLTVPRLSLGPAYPNPARNSVSFSFGLAQSGQVSWYVTDVHGRILYEERSTWAAGRGTIHWNGLTSRGRPVPAGIYHMRVEAQEEALARSFAIVH
jgi:hypothetical protein